MKVMLIGANGQLASDLLQVFRAAGDTVVPVTHAQLDISNPAQLSNAVSTAQPEVVLNTAAFHKVDECETNPDLAFLVNGTAAKNLAMACTQANAVLLHISTDYVFGGYSKYSPFEVDDRPAPLNVYGVSKLAGEHLIASNCERFFIVRTCGLYGIVGSSGKGGNFVESMLKKAYAGEAIRVVDDQVLTPTYTADLAVALRKLLLTGEFGLYHISSEGQCSWYEFTRHIMHCAGLGASVTPIKTADFSSPAKRPAYSVLSKAKFNSYGFLMPSWQDALPRYFAERRKKIAARNAVVV